MSVFAHTLWRTSRLALNRGSNGNPVRQALGVKGATKYAAACRTYATAFERSKPHVNVGNTITNIFNEILGS
jgi:elongation factor Tu